MLRHHQFGEGRYEEAEMILQRLLADAGTGDVGHDLVSVGPRIRMLVRGPSRAWLDCAACATCNFLYRRGPEPSDCP